MEWLELGFTLENDSSLVLRDLIPPYIDVKEAIDSFAADVPDGSGGIVADPNFNADYWEGAFYSEVQNPLGRRNRAHLPAG